MKTALVIRHAAHEGIAGFRGPIEGAGYRVEQIAACAIDFASVDSVAPDLLVVMGGPMAAYEQDAYPWLADEIAAVARRLAADRPTLGVCLGSQLIAAALGARVYRGSHREIGFAPVTLSDAGEESPLRHLAGVDVLHWHGDTFDLPTGCGLLASTAAYARQAFARGPNLLALQFHGEMGDDLRFDDWLTQDAAYLADAGVDAAELRATHDRLGPAAVGAGKAMLAEWLAGLNRV